LPDIGTLQTYITPKGAGVRVDDGFEQGMEIPIYYDPMIAKLIAYGKDRTEAIERMIRAIDEYQITGITTTLGFGKFVMQHEAFTSGNFDTHFVKKHFTPEVLQTGNEEEARIAAILMEHLLGEKKAIVAANVIAGTSNWVKNRSRL
jgi:acetyl-CoA carboxylase biotin carboxylase subunit